MVKFIGSSRHSWVHRHSRFQHHGGDNAYSYLITLFGVNLSRLITMRWRSPYIAHLIYLIYLTPDREQTIVDPQLEEIICNNCGTIISENIQDDPDQSGVLGKPITFCSTLYTTIFYYRKDKYGCHWNWNKFDYLLTIRMLPIGILKRRLLLRELRIHWTNRLNLLKR